MRDISTKKIIIFDLDGTLAASKSKMDDEMSDLLSGLLVTKKIAVISGGSWKQFNEQFLDQLQCRDDLLLNLFLFPTTGTRFYRYKSKIWIEVYADVLDPEERSKIKVAFETVFEEIGYKHPEKVYGEIIEDRGTQITFSALGQGIVKELGGEGVKLKHEWKEANQDLKLKIALNLRKLLPEFEVRTGGLTSIDVTKKGIDKAYGMRQIEKFLKIPISEMLFVGDALYPGGNDYAAIEAGVDTIAVSGPEETKKLIGGWL
ncbi:MAG: HAD-IIB family hydrolase [bacterium]|nr:HAD-IIB family hydrolase [bacterium]